MKTLSKLLIPCLGLICLLSGCTLPIVDPVRRVFTSEYTYKNECSSDVTMNVDMKSENPKFVISKASQYTLKIVSKDQFSPFPFCYYDGDELNGIRISNGYIDLYLAGSDKTGILDDANYQLIESNEFFKHYEYTFTDDFFKNGTPITE